MATIASSPKTVAERERAFFLYMAMAMAAIIIGGFSVNLALRRSSFALPLIYHVHAFVFVGWLTLYLLQNVLVATGSVRLHRSLGWLALVWIPAMVGMGMAMTIHSVRSTGGPFFFDTNEFLFGNTLGILAFAGIAISAILMRRRADWHKRLMCCAMATLTGPGFGRILPMPLLIPWAWWIASVIAPAIFPLIGIMADRRRTGRAHLAWFWGIGALVASQLITDIIAYSPAGYALTRSVTAGMPGAERDMKAHFP